MDAVRPFNLYMAAFRGTAGGITSTPSLQTYLIDATGNIDFPVIGTVPIGGLSRKEATRLVTDKLLPYIKDPIVIIRITNFKISVLGEVNAPGTFNIPNERVTLPEALGLASDLSIQGIRANILIIREVDGKITKNYIDLRTNALFSSPFYYLQQNDVVYIEPNNSRIKESKVNPNTSIFLSSMSILISLLAILTL
jgi:polysaccharide export outer membrane protein